MSEDESPAERFRRLWADPATRPNMHRGSLQKRLKAARGRRDEGKRPYPLDNSVLAQFGEMLNPREHEKPVEPLRGVSLKVLEALRGHPDGLTAAQLAELLNRPEARAGSVRMALDGLRDRCCQPILLTPEGRFRLLRPGEY